MNSYTTSSYLFYVNQLYSQEKIEALFPHITMTAQIAQKLYFHLTTLVVDLSLYYLYRNVLHVKIVCCFLRNNSPGTLKRC